MAASEFSGRNALPGTERGGECVSGSVTAAAGDFRQRQTGAAQQQLGVGVAHGTQITADGQPHERLIKSPQVSGGVAELFGEKMDVQWLIQMPVEVPVDAVGEGGFGGGAAGIGGLSGRP